MKANQPIASIILAVLSLVEVATRADRIAVVNENNLNVRGQPAFSGEVITQLQKGERVVVLEDIAISKPKPGEPAIWRRIQMPANTPVWIFAPFIDSNTKTVNTSRLNMRAGPGENFSILGRLERGQTVKDIRTVDDWMEIETPSTAEAYVAAQFLTLQEESPEPKPGESPPAESPVSAQARPVETDGTNAEPKTTEVLPNAEPLEIENTTIPAPGTIRPAPALESTIAVPLAIAPLVIPEPPPTTVTEVVLETPRRRIVRREGIVRSTRSIQAPTYFELISKDTGRVINYLQAKKEGLDLKDFKGNSIIASGEEGIESRWPTTPILMIETLELAP
ncbi:MAG: SH3 domain-containing protein [Verrucomicrobia bacterium]|nr:SH3 domain-containing protein [Verrucomicrobiota bacterium]